MGCDIHVFIERRVDNLFPWETDPGHTISIEDAGTEDEHIYYNRVTATGRDYNLFGKLAGVRSGGQLFEERGMPEDASDFVRAACARYGSDGHTHSYLSLDEFKKCLIAAGYDLRSSDNSEAFYNWEDYSGRYNSRPPNYIALINYCENWIKQVKQEDFMGIDEYRPEVRLVFWFDN